MTRVGRRSGISATDLMAELENDPEYQRKIYFIRPILKIGGDRGREVVEGLRADPVFGDEATALLNRRRSRR